MLAFVTKPVHKKLVRYYRNQAGLFLLPARSICPGGLFFSFAQVHQGEFPVIPSRLVLLLFRRSRLAIRSRVRVASLRRCAPLTAQAFAAPFRCDGGSGGNDNSIELANGIGMDAVLIARFSPGWTEGGCKSCLSGGVAGSGWYWRRAGLASRIAAWFALLAFVRTIFLCQAHFAVTFQKSYICCKFGCDCYFLILFCRCWVDSTSPKLSWSDSI